jgi:hypothetical protein
MSEVSSLVVVLVFHHQQDRVHTRVRTDHSLHVLGSFRTHTCSFQDMEVISMRITMEETLYFEEVVVVW